MRHEAETYSSHILELMQAGEALTYIPMPSRLLKVEDCQTVPLHLLLQKAAPPGEYHSCCHIRFPAAASRRESLRPALRIGLKVSK